MDHSEVVQGKLAERYVLGELSPEAREQFEEHCFECLECASDLKVLSEFVAASRAVLQEEAAAKNKSRERSSDRPRGAFWLRPAFTVPAMAALAAVVIFQAVGPNLKTAPRNRSVAQVYDASYRIQGATRGDNAARVAVVPNENFALDFDFTPNRECPRYKGSLIDSTGIVVLTFEIPAGETNKELHLVVPGGLVRPGAYQLVFVGQNSANDANVQDAEVQRLSFAIDFR